MPHVTKHISDPMPNITVTTNGVEKLLSDIKVNKASGPDNIPNVVLKNAPTASRQQYHYCSKSHLTQKANQKTGPMRMSRLSTKKETDTEQKTTGQCHLPLSYQKY